MYRLDIRDYGKNSVPNETARSRSDTSFVNGEPKVQFLGNYSIL